VISAFHRNSFFFKKQACIVAKPALETALIGATLNASLKQRGMLP
jgi:hypothetical protein